MKFRKTILTTSLVLLLAGVPTAAVSQVEIEGVTFERAQTVTGTPLELRGYGLLRYMVFIKAYVGAFYLPPETSDADALGPVAKRLELQYFHAIKKQDFARATRAKIADNVTPEQALQLKTRIDQLAAMYRDVRPGDRYSLTYIPGQGTELALNGTSLGTLPGRDFSRALFAVWLGGNPIDADFRDVLLGAR